MLLKHARSLCERAPIEGRSPGTPGSRHLPRYSAMRSVVGVLLAANLAAARPFGPANAPVAHIVQTRRTLTGYVMDDTTIRTAVTAWLADATAAEATYGHISTWETEGVTDISELFQYASSFNEDIGAWYTSGVTSMFGMFQDASSFIQDIGDWAVESVTSMFGMFQDA